MWTLCEQRAASSEQRTGSSAEKLINKRPIDPKPHHQPRCGIVGGSEVVVVELEAAKNAGGIDIFQAEEGAEAPDTEMHKGVHVRQIGDPYRILVKKPAQHG